jgi:hypothetical protein
MIPESGWYGGVPGLRWLALNVIAEITQSTKGMTCRKSPVSVKVSNVAVAAAPVPAPPEKAIVGAVRYPLPVEVRTMVPTPYPSVTVAPVPVPPVTAAALVGIAV